MQKVFITQWSLVSKAGSGLKAKLAVPDTSSTCERPADSFITMDWCASSSSGDDGMPCRARYCGLAYSP